MKTYIYQIIVFIVGVFNCFAQQTPAPKQTEIYTITGGTAHLGNGKIIENACIQFSDGKITYVGNNDNTTEKKGVKIDATGKHIYPGLIVANSSLGIGEIDAVRATRDFDEIGNMLPHIRSIIAYNTESKVIETMRPNGVLLGQITPRGGYISGTSSIVQFDAWNWEDAVVKLDDAIHINWPSIFARPKGWNFGGARDFTPNKKYDEQTQKLKTFFQNAKTYLNGKRTPKNLPFEAVENVFNSNQKVFIHVNGKKSIMDAIDIFLDLNIKSIVIVKGQGAEKVSDVLVKHNIPVILERAHRLPSSEDEDYDLPFRTAKLLSEAGVVVGIGMEGDMERMSSRNLPFYAGTYAAYGLGKEKALQLITENNAKILGIDNNYGTLEVGKSATLFISKGDALDMATNQLTDAFIDGRKISLESHQTKLWKRYSNKYQSQ